MSTTKCQNCGKEIETFKMVLHERFCSLNVRKCSICNEPIQIDEYSEHKNLKHIDLNCKRCGKKFPADKYDSHLKSCSKKLVECKFCGLFLEQNELKEHEYQCGSKTMQCDYCGLNIPQMEYDLHLEYTCKIKQKFDNPKIENSSKKGQIDESLKNMKDLENQIFGKKQKERNNIKNKDKKRNHSKDIIKFEDFYNEANTKNKKSNYIQKYADDYINNSSELNLLDFGDDINEIPNDDNRSEVNTDKNEINNNNDNNIIDDILYKGRKRGETKNKNKSFEKKEKKEKKQKKDKNKEKERKKRRRGNKRKNSSSFSNSFSKNDK